MKSKSEMLKNNPLPVYDFIVMLEQAIGPEKNWTFLQREVYSVLCENYVTVHEMMHSHRGDQSCHCQSWEERNKGVEE